MGKANEVKAKKFSDDKVNYLNADLVREKTVVDNENDDGRGSSSQTLKSESLPGENGFLNSIFKTKTKEFSFLADNHTYISAEIDTFEKLLPVLEKNKADQVQDLLSGCYELLHIYYETRGDSKKAKEFKQKIEKRPQEPRSFKKRAIDGLKDVYSGTTNFDNLYDWTSYLNLLRIYWLFSRLSLNALVDYSNSTNHWMDKANVASPNLTVSQSMQIINAANETMLYLSVALFALKLVFVILQTIEYFIKTRKKEGLDAKIRDQLVEQHIKVINDSMWLIVNAITNFTQYSKIPVPIANWLTAGFLVADVMVLVWLQIFHYRVHCNRKKVMEYQIEKSKDLEGNLEGNSNVFIVNQQLQILEAEYQAKFFTINANIIGAMLIVAGFATGIAACSGGFALSLLGTSVYMASKSLETLLKAQFEVNRISKIEKNVLSSDDDELKNWIDVVNATEALAKAKVERNRALVEFILVSVFKNIILPQAIIVLFPICWPASVALAVVLVSAILGHKIYQTLKSDNTPEDKPEDKPALLDNFGNQDDSRDKILFPPEVTENFVLNDNKMGQMKLLPAI